MPLIVLVGIPQSGKTRVSMEIKDYFELQGVNVEVINEEMLGIDKSVAYSSNFDEKNLRASLKSAVERSLSAEHVVVIDSLNYIKGYRYELFCIVRQTRTTQCVIYMDIPKEIALKRNLVYPEALFEDLANRMEVPNQKNKWDSPLIILRDSEITPVQDIFQRIIHGRNLTENMATVKQPALVQDYLHLLDQSVQKAIDFILKAQEDYSEGTNVPVPDTQIEYFFQKKVSALQLKKLKQQFIKMNKMQPCSLDTCVSTFVDYINTNMS